MFGWVVNGPLHSWSAMDSGLVVPTANRISVGQLKDLLIRQYNQDFSEKEYEKKSEMSVEDRKFMEIASTSVLNHRHYPSTFAFSQ